MFSIFKEFISQRQEFSKEVRAAIQSYSPEKENENESPNSIIMRMIDNKFKTTDEKN